MRLRIVVDVEADPLDDDPDEVAKAVLEDFAYPYDGPKCRFVGAEWVESHLRQGRATDS